MKTELELVKEQLAELEATFDLRHKADIRAIAQWREGHPERELTIPDHADLVCFLAELLEKANEELTKTKSLLKYSIEDSCEDDTAIRDLCRPFLTPETCDHDGYGVVPLVDVVQNVIKHFTK